MLVSYMEKHREYLAKFTNYEVLNIVDKVEHTDCVVTVLDDMNIVIPLKELINIEEEITKLNQQIKKLEAEVERCNHMLNNPNFTSRAPESKIQTEKEKLFSYTKQLEEARGLLEGLMK